MDRPSAAAAGPSAAAPSIAPAKPKETQGASDAGRDGGVDPAKLANANDGQSRPEIPERFAGEWNVNLAHCGTDLNDSRVRIEPRRIRFYESVGEVTKVTARSADDVTVSARFAGEGETWTASHRMILSPSGADLTIDDVTRHRCPVMPAAK
ncbi:hypothetical protein [Sphingosinicella sp. BN140058]|uniref:hypothetical protein n=1 Tax=Sphingosinicella sp. BN140058 TaxID=1892855 RepID=UPI00101109BE|nr:hypothetical protein [Sphingosinicella sp. BN140058]QAY75224.1 hypothetical protein ETR14_00765 [Sphingosinicella sp. BN140058]